MRLLGAYEAGLKIVLRHRFITLLTMFATIALTGYLYVVIPKGFFPQQDTGLIIGLSEAAQDISYSAMAERQQALLNAIMKDPAVASVGSAIGAGGGNTTVNNGRVYIALKPYKQRDSMETVLARLRTNLAKIQGITLYMQAAQDITIGGRVSKTQYQYTLGDADPGELNHWAALFLDRIKKIPGITDVATDQHNSGPLLDITIKREVASSYGILPFTIDNTLDDAFGQRIVSTMYTTLNQYHVDHGGQPEIPVLAGGAERHLCQILRRPGSAAIDAGRQRGQGRPARGQPPGPVPVGDDLLQPAAGHGNRRSDQRHPACRAATRQAAVAADEFPGQRAGLRRFAVEHADPDRGGAVRDLPHPRHIV